METQGGKIIEINYDTDLNQILNEIDGWLIPGGSDIDAC